MIHGFVIIITTRFVNADGSSISLSLLFAATIEYS